MRRILRKIASNDFDQLGDIKQLTNSFLAGDVDEITDFDSLRKVREYFT